MELFLTTKKPFLYKVRTQKNSSYVWPVFYNFQKEVGPNSINYTFQCYLKGGDFDLTITEGYDFWTSKEKNILISIRHWKYNPKND